MQHGFKTSNQQGFSLIELLVTIMLMFVVGGAVFALMRDSLKVTVATYELTDAQESLRAAQEFVNRDVLNAGDGLKTLSTIRLPQAFVTNYLTRAPVTDPATPGIINLGIITSDNNVPATAVPQASPAATYSLNTDRQTILEIDATFTPVTPTAISASGSTVTIPASYPLTNFTAGEIYFLTSDLGGTFAAIRSIDTVNRRLDFSNGDPYGLNLTGNGGHIKAISNSGALPTSLQRMKMIHYYVKSNGMLMRRVFGAKCSPTPAICAGFRESPIAEHIINVQFNYSMATTDASGNVVPSTSTTLTTSEQQIAVRQVEVKITAETPKVLQNGQHQQLSTTTSTSVRNMQFRQALQP